MKGGKKVAIYQYKCKVTKSKLNRKRMKFARESSKNKKAGVLCGLRFRSFVV